MTEKDEETKEHPVYPAATPEPADSEPVAPHPPTSFGRDPLEPTTTVGGIPPIPPGLAPINPAPASTGPSYPAAPPVYQQPPGGGWAGQGYPTQQPGYGQPGYTAPGYGQPAYGGAPGYAQTPSQQWGAEPRYHTSFLVALAGFVLILFGLALAILGAWTLSLGPDLGRFIRDNDIAIFGRQIERDLLRTVVQPLPGILMVLGVLELLVGSVILAHRSWARWLGVLLALLGLIVSVIALSAVLALVPGVSLQLMVASVLVVGNAFVLLALIAGGGHFTRRYPRR